VNRWFELIFKKLFEMLEFIQPARISTEPFFLLFPGSGEILFCRYSFILCGTLENDPLSPPKGEAVQGEHPIDPLFSGYISTLSGVIAPGGMPERRGRKHEKPEPPKSDCLFL
jgi:hypothetical protein